MLSVESKWNQSVLVKRVNQGVRVDVHRSSVEHNLVDLGEFLQEEGHSGSDKYVDLDRTTFNEYFHLKVALSSCPTGLQVGRRKLAVDQGLVKVEHKCLPPPVLWGLRSDDRVLSWHWLLAEAASALKLQ